MVIILIFACFAYLSSCAWVYVSRPNNSQKKIIAEANRKRNLETFQAQLDAKWDARFAPGGK